MLFVFTEKERRDVKEKALLKNSIFLPLPKNMISFKEKEFISNLLIIQSFSQWCRFNAEHASDNTLEAFHSADWYLNVILFAVISTGKTRFITKREKKKLKVFEKALLALFY